MVLLGILMKYFDNLKITINNYNDKILKIDAILLHFIFDLAFFSNLTMILYYYY
jgi:hypothetical protein